MGDEMNYWDFFPAGDGWVRMPVWGFADVTASMANGVPEGTRIFGYLPPPPTWSSGRTGRAHKTSSTPPPIAPSCRPPTTATSGWRGCPCTRSDNEDQQMLLWPLYLHVVPDRRLSRRRGVLRRQAAVALQRLEPTSSALAYLLDKREGIEVVGLTSPRNVEFTESLGVYDRVVPYEELESLDRDPAVYVDMAGDARVRSAVHGHWGDRLKHSAAVGLTHREDLGGGAELAGPKPVFFFAPDRLRKRREDWGGEGVNERLAETWNPYVEWTRDWLRVEHGSGPEDVERIYRELLDGKSDPAVGHVLSPGD